MKLDIKACEQLNIDRVELAKMLDVSPATIANWDRGKKMPKMAEIALNLLIENSKLKKAIKKYELLQINGDTVNKFDNDMARIMSFAGMIKASSQSTDDFKSHKIQDNEYMLSRYGE